MKQSDIDRFRQQLMDSLHALEVENARGAEGQKTVELDQQSVGRLSRMDALQSQAMAKAGQQRRNANQLRIKAALARMDEEEFGYCIDCGEEIAHKRLELDPTIPTCISCAKG